MITYCPTWYSCAGSPKNERSVLTDSPPCKDVAMMKFARCVAVSYQSDDVSHGTTAGADAAMGATTTLPPLVTVVLSACQ